MTTIETRNIEPGSVEPGHETSTDAARPRASFTSFAESTKEDWALIMSEMDATMSLAAANIIVQMRMLARDHGGFPVSRLEHSLQTATRAERAGRDDEYVLCALVHDIGDTLAPYNHPEIGASIVKPFVSEANHWMVQHHGIFQGYYFWHHVGGDRNTRDAYADSPFYEQTAEFCAEYDQVAFDPTYVSNPLEHYEPLIRQVFDPLHG